MITIIKEQNDYINNKDVYNRTDYLDKLTELLKSNNIVVVEGQRRVGKSSIIVSFIKNLNISLEKIFYINKELDIKDNIKDSNYLQKVFDEFVINFSQPEYIIIDEIQDIINWEKFIRKYNSYKKYKIIITGSNSKLLSGELSTYLTGRYLTMHVGSFSYKEFIQFSGQEVGEKSFNEYIIYGGMPEILFIENKETKKNYIKNVVSNIVLKDIVSRYNIRDIKLIEKILAFLSDNTGSLVSITKIGDYLKNQFKKEYSTKTIANYIKYLEFPYIVNEVNRFDIKGKKILEYVGKYYFSDIGIRNNYGFVFSKDIGKILENLVYLKLIQEGYEIYIGNNDGMEIDFIGIKNAEKIYIQVTYLLSSEDVIEREFGNLLKIKDNYKKIVISMDKTFGNTYEGIENINIIDYLMS